MDNRCTYNKSATDKLKVILDSLWCFTYSISNSINAQKEFLKKNLIDVRELILAGADPNAISIEKYPSNKMTVLEFMTEKNMVSEAAQLIALGANPNFCSDDFSVLTLSISQEASDCVELLLAKGADINFEGREGTPLYWAVRIADYPLARRLIEMGASIHTSLNSPWLTAACEANLDMFKLLLERNIQVNAVDKYGTNAFLAVANGHLIEQEGLLQKIYLLLQAGIDPYYRAPDGHSALNSAASDNKSKVVAVLLEYGLDPNCASQKTETTSLMCAAWHGSVEMARDLLEHGADPSMMDKRNQRAIDIARTRGKDNIIPLLQKHKIA